MNKKTLYFFYTNKKWEMKLNNFLNRLNMLFKSFIKIKKI
jgi:hypothetical protein